MWDISNVKMTVHNETEFLRIYIVVWTRNGSQDGPFIYDHRIILQKLFEKIMVRIESLSNAEILNLANASGHKNEEAINFAYNCLKSIPFLKPNDNYERMISGMLYVLNFKL